MLKGIFRYLILLIKSSLNLEQDMCEDEQQMISRTGQRQARTVMPRTRALGWKNSSTLNFRRSTGKQSTSLKESRISNYRGNLKRRNPQLWRKKIKIYGSLEVAHSTGTRSSRPSHRKQSRRQEEVRLCGERFTDCETCSSKLIRRQLRMKCSIEWSSKWRTSSQTSQGWEPSRQTCSQLSTNLTLRRPPSNGWRWSRRTLSSSRRLGSRTRCSIAWRGSWSVSKKWVDSLGSLFQSLWWRWRH